MEQETRWKQRGIISLSKLGLWFLRPRKEIKNEKKKKWLAGNITQWCFWWGSRSVFGMSDFLCLREGITLINCKPFGMIYGGSLQYIPSAETHGLEMRWVWNTLQTKQCAWNKTWTVSHFEFEICPIIHLQFCHWWVRFYSLRYIYIYWSLKRFQSICVSFNTFLWCTEQAPCREEIEDGGCRKLIQYDHISSMDGAVWL